MSEKQTIKATDVGGMPAGVVAALSKPVARGAGTFTPPGDKPAGDKPAGPARGKPANPARDDLLQEHKALNRQIATLVARRDEVETQIAMLDARASVAAKLQAMSPAELAILNDTLAEKAQKRIDQAAETKPKTPAG